MTRIFKNIRQKLAAENKVMGYLRYAIGEILLVVIGILIALQINNWNEGRKHSVAEMEFFEGIKNDLTQDKEFIKLIISINKPKIEAFSLLNEKNTSGQTLDKNYADSLFQKYLFSPQRTFYPISGSFQSAVAGNEINTYKNKKVTRSLIKLYNSTYTRLIDNGNILDDRWSHISEIFIHERRINHFNKMNNAQISKVLDTIYFHFIELKYYQNILNKTVIEIDELLQKIK